MRSTPTLPSVRFRVSALIAVGATALALPVVAADAPTQDLAQDSTPESTPAITDVRIAADAAERADVVDAAPPDDVVVVYDRGPLTERTATRALAATRKAGATAAIGRSASVGMLALWRGDSAVQRPPSGYVIPMGTTVLPLDLIGRTMSRDVSRALSASTVVMGQRSADLRGAQVGDTIDLVSGSGSTVRFRLAMVAADDVIGGTELLISPSAGDRLEIERISRVVIWDFPNRATIDAALTRNGLVSTATRIRRSWDPPDPDSTLGMARLKEELGEFAYRVDAGGSVSIDPRWTSANIVKGPIAQLALQSGCHQTVRVGLQAAMDDVIDAGLEDTISYADANRFGGCFVPRFNRLTPDSFLGFLSRHTWGGAVDTNTQGSCQGCVPDIDCRTVRIFREHGFAWGGNFLTPDGMHFEWVGEPRHELEYPSRFCRNEVSTASAPFERSAVGDHTQRATLYADDGLSHEH